MENVKQNTTKYKILFILSFLLLTLLLFNTNVFATETIQIEGTDIIISDDILSNFSYYTILKGDIRYYLSVGNSPFILYTRNGVSRIEATNYNHYGTGVLSDLSNYSNLSVNNTSSHDFQSAEGVVEVLYSNCNIYDNTGELVFQLPVQGTTLAQVLAETQENNPKLVLVEIAKILTLIIVVVVSLVGFRKAWKILRTSLNRS